jgi:hypothetical protein
MAEKKASEKNPEGALYLRRFLIGLMMVVGGFILSITVVGAIIGVPLFLTGFVVMGFFYAKLKQSGRKQREPE